MQRTLLTEESISRIWSKMNGTGHPRCLSSERSRGTFIYVYGPPQCRSFLETTDLPCWRHGEWLHLCSLRCLPSLRVPAHLLRWRRSGCRRFCQLRSQYSWRSMARRDLLRLCLRQALQLADVVKLSKKNGDLSVEKHRTIGIYAPCKRVWDRHVVGD